MGVGMIPIELDMCIMDSQATGIEVYVLSVKFLKRPPVTYIKLQNGREGTNLIMRVR